jgi:acetyl esterase/lipase
MAPLDPIATCRIVVGPRRIRRVAVYVEALEPRSLLAGISGTMIVSDPASFHLGRTQDRAVPIPVERHHRIVGGHGRVVRNIVYQVDGSNVETLDVLLPAGTPPTGGWPVVVAIHGGGWRQYDSQEYEPTVAPLAKAGYAIVAPNYLLSAPGSPSWPTATDDVRDAVRWVRASSSVYGLNAGQIAAIGESAGGHLAALLGTDPNGGPPSSVSASVNAVIDFFGPTDLTSIVPESSAAAFAVEQFLGATPAQAPTMYSDASPVDHVSATSAPTLIIQGTNDPIVPVSQSVELANALGLAGVANRLVLISGAGHGFGFKVGGRDLLPDILTFLQNARTGAGLS